MAIYQNAGIDPFEQRRLRNRLMDLIEKRQGRTEGGYMGGPTAGQFGLMSQTMPTAQERQAFTNRNIARAQYGRAWQGGGFPRYGGGLAERALGAEQQQKAAEAKQKAHQDWLKEREVTEKERKGAWERAGGGLAGAGAVGATPGAGTPQTTQPRQGSGQTIQPILPAQSAQSATIPINRGGGTMTVSQEALNNMGRPYMTQNQREGIYNAEIPRSVQPQGPIHTFTTPGSYEPGLGARARQQLASGASTATAGVNEIAQGLKRPYPDEYIKNQLRQELPIVQQITGMKGRQSLGPQGGAGGSFARVVSPENKKKRKGLLGSLPQPLTEAIKTLPRNKRMDQQAQMFLNWLKSQPNITNEDIHKWGY